ncbi:hypothetical protein [Acinetobacter sp.]|uniref:hypothetical protein n=1 Tax=Acinetobacter sp. TaxID=472 RepID=UPI00388F0E0C
MLILLSNWFDSLKEPKRFVVFTILVFGWYIPFMLVVFLDSTFSGLLSLKALLVVLGFCQVIFFLAFAISRALRK